MKTILERLQLQAEEALRVILGRECMAELTPSTNPRFGHYQCNSSLSLAPLLGISPRELAQRIVAGWPKEPADMIEKMEVAGPGFVNIFLRAEYLSHEITTVSRDPRLGIEAPETVQRIIVEFSSPNIAKELHVGHLRSTLIGDSIARLFEFLGHEVLRLNHIGDWGTQFGMLIAYMKEKCPEVLAGNQIADLSSLTKWYRQSKVQFDEDGEFKKRAQKEVVALQRGDPSSRHAWEMICDVSVRAYREIYQLLDVSLVDRGESFYNSDLPQLVEELSQKGMITLSGGAKCIYLEGYQNREGDPLPIIIQKSDGGYNYDTTEMAAFRHRVQVEQADRIVIVTDAGQSLHFEMIAKAAEQAGYLDRSEVQFDHVPFGVVLGSDGKKFKTRSGDTERLIDLLMEGILHAKSLLKARGGYDSEEELDRAAHIVGIDAIKYADLSSHRVKDYLFSYERMLRLEGNTAPFLLYAYVRMESIKRRIGKPLPTNESICLTHPTEVSLALHLLRFPEIIDLFAQELLPHRLADYLYHLAEQFHAFFRDCHVEGSKEEGSRLLLCDITGRILRKGMEILGLQVIERM